VRSFGQQSAFMWIVMCSPTCQQLGLQKRRIWCTRHASPFPVRLGAHSFGRQAESIISSGRQNPIIDNCVFCPASRVEGEEQWEEYSDIPFIGGHARPHVSY
jgi:hypothetical protein